LSAIELGLVEFVEFVEPSDMARKEGVKESGGSVLERSRGYLPDSVSTTVQRQTMSRGARSTLYIAHGSEGSPSMSSARGKVPM